MLNNKIAVVFTALLVMAFLTGCGEKKETTTTTTDKKTETTTTTKTETKTTATDTTSKTNTTTTTQTKDSTMTDTKSAGDNKTTDGDYVDMQTTMGDIVIKLYTDKAPITTANFKKLVNEGFYNGIIFHRVIDGFMIQGGDPTGTGTGGSKVTIQDEFGEGLKHSKKGLLSMANRGPNTGTSQFFITLDATPWLDGKHAIFGEVVKGMDVVEKIGKTKVGPGDKPVTDVKMTKVTVTDKP